MLPMWMLALAWSCRTRSTGMRLQAWQGEGAVAAAAIPRAPAASTADGCGVICHSPTGPAASFSAP